MSGPPRVRSVNISDSDHRSILGPAGNKTRSVDTRKPSSKPQRKVEKTQKIEAKEKQPEAATPSPPQPPSPAQCGKAPSILRHLELSRRNASMSASCSSDASTDSSHSRASTGRITRRVSTPVRRKQCGQKTEKVENSGSDGALKASDDASTAKRRCAWVTPNTDPCYATFHDEEWGVQVHDDKKLFELLSLSGALAELTWSTILSKRHIFREVFLDFDPVAVAKLNEKKLATPGSCASLLLSEQKLRSVIENARQICKILDEFGSFDTYIWNFINHNPIISRFRYARQVPVKTSKAEFISKDMVRRGFRGVGPTVIYSFMQVAGLTNDHLISCFRFEECVSGGEGRKLDSSKADVEEHKMDKKPSILNLSKDMDILSLSE